MENKLVGTITAIDTFLGVILGISKSNITNAVTNNFILERV
ncbi:MAG: phage holin [Oliverpabstia sp.]